MKKFLLILVAVCLASSANAGIYFGGRGGYGKYKVESSNLDLDHGKSTYLLGADLGYHTGFFRVEAEYLYRPKRNFDDKFKDEVQTVMGNLFFAPPLKGWFHPYLMGGAGVAFHSSTYADSTEHKDHNLAWQAGLGVEMEFTNNVFFDVGGRMIDSGDPEYENIKVDTKGYFYYFGLRFEY